MSRFLPSSILLSVLFILPMAACYDPGAHEPTDDPARGGKSDSILSGSCQDACGTSATEGNCWCDEACAGFGDCCSDYASMCVVTALSFGLPEVIGERSSDTNTLDAWAGLAIDDAGVAHVVYAGTGSRATYASASNDFVPVLLADSDGIPGEFVREGMAISARTGSDVVDVGYINSGFELHQIALRNGEVVSDANIGKGYRSIGMANAPAPVLAAGAGELQPGIVLREGLPGAATQSRIRNIDNVTLAPESPSVAIDAEGGVHVAYGARPTANLLTTSGLRYAYRAPGGQWQDRGIPTRATYLGGAIAIDPQGQAAIAFSGFSAEGVQTLFVARDTSTGWEIEAVVNGPGRSANVQFDGTGRLHLVYRLSGDVLYQRQDVAGAWSEAQVLDQDIRMANDRIAMAFAPNGQLHIVYSDGKSRELRHLVSE